MIHHIPNVLTKQQVAEFRALMDTAQWVNGKVTAGTLSASVKHNQQLSEQDPLTHHLSDLVIQAIWNNPAFQTAALPHHIIPPLFNRYDEHESFGFHVDNSIRLIRGTSQQMRTDLSCTLFLSEPEEYDGGDLVIEDTYGYHEVKLPAVIWCFIRQPVCMKSVVLLAVVVSLHFFGYKVWFEMIPNDIYFLIWMKLYVACVYSMAMAIQR